MTVLQDFREQYPQYADLDDEQLGEALRTRYYDDLEPEAFRAKVGLPPLPEPPKPPTLRERINGALFGKAKKADPLKVESPPSVLATEELDAVDDWLMDITEDPTKAGLTPSQFNSVRDWLAPDPAQVQQEAREYVDRLPPPRSPAPLLDQFFAGWDEYRANKHTPAALETGGRIGAIDRGEQYSSLKPGPLGISGEDLMGQVRQSRDPEAYRQTLVNQLQRVLDARSDRLSRAETVPFAPSTEKVLEAESLGEGVQALADDPIRIIAELSVRSLPNMAEMIPLAITGALMAGPPGFMVGAGTGSANVEYRARLSEYLTEAGYDLNKAEDLIAISSNPELLRAASNRAALEAGIIGTVDALTAGAATKTIVPPQVKGALARELANLATQTGIQVAGGSGGEYLAGQASGHPSAPGEILAEGIAETGTVIVDVGSATVTGLRQQKAENEVSRIVAEINEQLDKAPTVEVSRGTLEGTWVETLPPVQLDADGNVVTPRTSPPAEPEPAPPVEPTGPEATPVDETSPDTDVARTINLDGVDYAIEVKRRYETGERDITITLPDGDTLDTNLRPGETFEDAARLGQEYGNFPPADESPTVPPEIPAPADGVVFDVRLKRAPYRNALNGMKDELIPGGGITLVPEEGSDTAFQGRTPSQNPAWFQRMNQLPEFKMSVRSVWKAVDKAVRGEQLGVRQQRVVGYMLDEIRQERESREVMDYAWTQLQIARETRRQIRAEAGLAPADNVDQSGEIFEEGEYSDEMTAEARIIFELMEQATVAGVPEDILETMSIKYMDETDEVFIRALEEVISEQESQDGPDAVAPQPEAEAEPAGTVDGLAVGELSDDDRLAAHYEFGRGILEEPRPIRLDSIDRDGGPLEAGALDSEITDRDIDQFVDEDLPNRIRGLAGDIQRSGRIDPVVVVDEGGGEYSMLEGQHRIVALRMLGKELVPAAILHDVSELTDAQINERLAELGIDERIEITDGSAEPTETIEPELVQPGEKGAARQRKHKGVKKYLRQKRPLEDDAERIIDYRTGATMAYNQAVEDDAPAAVVEALRVEAVWATEWLRANKPEVIESLEGALARQRGDLFGDDTAAEQAIADEIRRRDAVRNTGQDELETGDPGDLFSDARRQTDIGDVTDDIGEGPNGEPRHPTSDGWVEYRPFDPGPQAPWDLTAEEWAAERERIRPDNVQTDYTGASASQARGRMERLVWLTANIFRFDTEMNESVRIRYEDVVDRGRREKAGRAVQASRRPDDELTDTGYFRQFGERRVDTERRINYANMPTDQLIELLYTDPLTGIANRRAFEEEGADHPWLASIDADSLKFINDNMSPDAGDAMLKTIAQALDQTGVDAYHISGDEFYLGAETREDLEAAMQMAKATLATATIRSGEATKVGIDITYGIGQTKDIADAVQKQQKVSREESGKRRGRDDPRPPPGFTKSLGMAAALNFEAGTNYVPIIGRHGDLPLDANRNYVLGDGRKVEIPKKPVRREHIISALRRHFGRRIFQGRVKGKTRLGFYRPGIGEIRIKHHNDLEVAAHEVAHWFDDRYPWIGRLYHQYTEEMKGVSYDKKQTNEGFAEFMRLWFTQDYKAYQAAPGFYDAFMTELEGHPQQRDAMKDLQMHMHAWHLQGARARGASKMGLEKEPILDRFRESFQNLPDKILQKVFDELRGFKQAERAVTGGVPSPAFGGYNSFRLAKGHHGVMLAIYHRGSIQWNAQGDIEFNGKGLQDIFSQVKGRLEEFVQYMVGRRAEELTSQGRENLFRPDEIAAFLAHEQAHPEFRQVFQEWLDFNTRMLDFYQDSGLLSARSRAAIDEMNKNYVPFNRIAEQIMGESKVKRAGSPFVRLKGGTQNINDVMDSIIGNTSHLVRLALLNRGKQNFYRMILNASGTGNTMAGNYAAPIGKDAVPVGIHKEQVVKAALEGMGLSMKWYKMAKNGFVQSDEELVVLAAVDQMMHGMEELVTFFQLGQDPKGNIDYMLEAGEKHFFEIIDPQLYESIQHLGPQSHNLAVSILGGFANLLRRGVVMTPTFQIKNFIRDTGNAFTLSKGKIIPALDAIKALMERIYTDEHYWQYLANGGGFASIAEAEGIEADRVMDSPAKLWAMYDRGISAFEYANRIAEFKKLREKGFTAREAALAGREISTDFAMHGASDAVRVLTISVPFLNARMQGLYRLVREMAHKSPAEGVGLLGASTFNYALRAIMTITIPSLALYAMNKDDERYQEIPDWIRDLNWIIFTGEGEDDYVMIPKPFETGMIWGTVPERALEYYYQRDEKELADAMLWMALQTFALDLTPQAFQPWYELQKNRKFTGAPIIPQYLQGAAPQEQWRYYTSDTMIALGRKLGISPMKAEHVVRGHFGTMGAWALGAADYMVGDISQGGERPSWDPWRENILLDPFVNKGPLRRTKSEDDLHELLRETRQITVAMSQMRRRNPTFIAEFVTNDAERQAYLALNQALESAAKQMGEIKNAMDMVASATDIDGDEKRRQIDALQRAKNQVAHEVRSAINPDAVRELIESIERDLAEAQTRTAADGS